MSSPDPSVPTGIITGAGVKLTDAEVEELAQRWKAAWQTGKYTILDDPQGGHMTPEELELRGKVRDLIDARDKARRGRTIRPSRALAADVAFLDQAVTLARQHAKETREPVTAEVIRLRGITSSLRAELTAERAECTRLRALLNKARTEAGQREAETARKPSDGAETAQERPAGAGKGQAARKPPGSRTGRSEAAASTHGRGASSKAADADGTTTKAPGASAAAGSAPPPPSHPRRSPRGDGEPGAPA